MQRITRNYPPILAVAVYSLTSFFLMVLSEPTTFSIIFFPIKLHAYNAGLFYDFGTDIQDRYRVFNNETRHSAFNSAVGIIVAAARIGKQGAHRAGARGVTEVIFISQRTAERANIVAFH